MASASSFENFGRIVPSETAVVLIECQNEFCSPGGKLHEAVRDCMEKTKMIENLQRLLDQIHRMNKWTSGTTKIIYAPITFDDSKKNPINAQRFQNPNRHLGILAGCDYDNLFEEHSWNAKCCDALESSLNYNSSNVIHLHNKHALSAFVGTELDAILKENDIKTVAFAGLMANCCVESSMRDAYDHGYNVIGLTDCVATTTMEGYDACTRITYPFVGTPMKSSSFIQNLREGRKFKDGDDKIKAVKEIGDTSNFADEVPAWRCRPVQGTDSQVYQVGPWKVKKKKKVEGEVKINSSGKKELERYINMAQCFGKTDVELDNCIYVDKLNEICEGTNGNNNNPDTHMSTSLRFPIIDSCNCEEDENGSFGWGCYMTVVKLPAEKGGGCLLYSPVLDDNNSTKKVVEFLRAEKLLPVRYILAPTPQHHLCLKEYQDLFPAAFLMCGRASGIMQSLDKRRRDLDFDCLLRPALKANDVIETEAKELLSQIEESETRGENSNGLSSTTVIWSKLVEKNPNCPRAKYKGIVKSQSNSVEACNSSAVNLSVDEHRDLFTSIFDVCIVNDNRTGEVVLLHKPSKTLIISDLLYKSTNSEKLIGPGGEQFRYTFPKWFAAGQEELFYKLENSDNSNGLLPAYRTHPQYRKIDLVEARKSLENILEKVKNYEINRCVGCHIDPVSGTKQICETLKAAWEFLFF